MLGTSVVRWAAPLCAAALFLSAQAQASQLRFSQTAAGNIVATGNALGLSKEPSENGPGIADSIGTFISLGNSADDFPANPGNPWGTGTTNDWTENGAEAELVLPRDAEVLYAELVWGGSTLYNTENVTGDLGSAVTIAAGGDSEAVAPDPLTVLDISEVSASAFQANYYMRSADVTDFVTAQGAGTYSVSGVPATQDAEIDALNAAGWTLVVAYRDSAQPIRNLTIFTGGSFVDEDSSEDYDFAGFCTPPSGAFAGSIAISAIEGDANRTGDSLGIAETDAVMFEPLSGPNNPEDNFFCSQINDSSGAVDTSGTFGSDNHNAGNGANVAGGRQSWDITQVAVSSADGHLSNGQTEAVIRTETTGDSFVPTTVAFAIEVNAPDFSGDGTGAGAEPTLIALDDTSTVTVSMENVGLVDAENIVFFAPLPEGLSLMSFSLDSNDVPGADLDAGVDIGTVAPDELRTIEFVVQSVGEPADGASVYEISPQWDYDYVSCVGEPPLTEPHTAPIVTIDFDPPAETADTATTGDDETADSGTDSAEADDGDASASAEDSADDGSGGISDSNTGGAAEGSDGCGCRSGDRSGFAMLGLFALLGLRRRSVRRSVRFGRDDA